MDFCKDEKGDLNHAVDGLAGAREDPGDPDIPCSFGTAHSPKPETTINPKPKTQNPMRTITRTNFTEARQSWFRLALGKKPARATRIPL